jgi:quercetin dioxygenase-like cupin family protein
LAVASGSSLTKSGAAAAVKPVAVVPLTAGQLIPADISRRLANGATVKLSTSGAILTLTQRVVVEPGAAEPWHVHPGSAIATLASGTLDNYVEYGSGCRHQVVHAGQSVVESGTTPHTLVNRGKVPAVVYTTVFNPVGARAGLQLKPKPPNCSA